MYTNYEYPAYTLHFVQRNGHFVQSRENAVFPLFFIATFAEKKKATV